MIMKKHDAIGVIEVQYFTIAMEVLDKVCKTADVEFMASENKLGGRLVSLIVGGTLSDITEAIEAAKLYCENKKNNHLKNALVISKPHPEILKYIIQSVEGDLVKDEASSSSTKQKNRRERRL